MTREETLFRAMGGVDAGLVETAQRPPERRPRHQAALWAGLAACLLLSLGLWRLAPWRSPAADSAGPSGPVTPVSPDNSGGSAQQGGPAFALADAPKVEGGAAHFLRLICALPEKAKEESADFYISVDQERYRLVQEAAGVLIQPVTPSPEDLPPCDLRITRFPNTSLEQALADAKAWCESGYARYEVQEDGALHAGDGTDWDDAQADIRLAEDGQGGVYRLTARYFTEATEGHGVRLNAMMNTFTPLAEGDPAAELRPTVDRLTAAALANDLTAVSDLLAENALVTGFGRDVSGEAAVSGMDISLAEDGGSASVTVRLTLLEEAPCRLHLDLVLEGGRWLASWGAVAMS